MPKDPPQAATPQPSSTSGQGGARVSRSDWIWAAAAIAVVVAAVVLYWPALGYGFVGWDDDRNVTLNPRVVEPGGLVETWTSLRGPAGWPNYPLFYTSFWLEYRLWGADPRGFHATNLGLHAINALLVLLVLRSLGVGRAVCWVVALLFACHPVQVESVAWITERKNLLSTMLYLLSFLLYVGFHRDGRRVLYALAILAFAGALLSKITAVTLVGSLFAAECLVLEGGLRSIRERAARGAGRLAPFVAVGVVAAVLLGGAEDAPLDPVPLAARPFIAARAIWFYAGKLLLPLNLIPIYPRWLIDPASTRAWLPLIALLPAVLATWRWRAALGGHLLVGLSHFVLTLLPALALVSFAYHTHSFVADRFVYLASWGLFLAVAVGIERLLQARWRPQAAARALVMLGVATAVVLALLTRRQMPIWTDSVQLWTHTVERNPDSWMAQHNLGSVLFFAGRADAALLHWRRCAQLQPRYLQAHVKVGMALQAVGEADDAVDHFRELADRHRRIPELRALYADALAAAGRVREASRLLQELITAAPQCMPCHERLAWIQATASESRYRNGARALHLARRAVELSPGPRPEPLDVLAAAHAETGEYEQAIATAKRALALAEQDGNEYLARQIRGRLAEYRAGRPYRDPRLQSVP